MATTNKKGPKTDTQETQTKLTVELKGIHLHQPSAHYNFDCQRSRETQSKVLVRSKSVDNVEALASKLSTTVILCA
ncbi:hypothetical protein J6590_098092 [Homalodisca vitripennis]|nr:hypothetical protein J6590_098092 [Homalodisca vitripennis]